MTKKKKGDARRIDFGVLHFWGFIYKCINVADAQKKAYGTF